MTQEVSKVEGYLKRDLEDFCTHRESYGNLEIGDDLLRLHRSQGGRDIVLILVDESDVNGARTAVDDVGGHGDLVCATLADDEAALTLEGFETLSRTRWLYSTVGRWVGRAQRLDHFCGLETKMM